MPISQKIAGFLEQGSWIRKMFEEGARLKAIHGEENVYDFSLGNPPEEPPKAFIKEFKRLAENPVPGMHRYMPNAGFPAVRLAIAKTISDECRLSLTERNVVMTVGAGGGMNVILKAILDPDDEVIMLAPFFPEYRLYADNQGGKAVVVNTTPEFMLDLNAIDKAINARTKAIIVNSPNNPTGVVYPEEQIKALGELLKKRCADLGRDIYLISDEPYKKLLFEFTEFPHVFKHVDNAIIVTSHSKDLSLAGERIGYVAASPKCADIERLCDALVFTNRCLGFVNAPALMQLIVAKVQDQTIDVGSYQKRRDLLYNNLTEMGFEMVLPQGGFYFFPKSPIEDDVAFVRAAQERRVLVAPGRGFGMEGYFRIAYSVTRQTIERSFGAWKELALEFGLKG